MHKPIWAVWHRQKVKQIHALLSQGHICIKMVFYLQLLHKRVHHCWPLGVPGIWCQLFFFFLQTVTRCPASVIFTQVWYPCQAMLPKHKLSHLVFCSLQIYKGAFLTYVIFFLNSPLKNLGTTTRWNVNFQLVWDDLISAFYMYL